MKSTDAACRVKVIILDVDGVMTDGRIGYGGPELIKFFDVRDGHWIKLALRSGFKVGVLTGRSDAASRLRAEDLGMSFIVEGALDKLAAFEELTRKLGVNADECMYIGDDVIDLPVMRRVGVAVAVSDALPELDEAASFRTAACGGRGAICEAIRWLFRSQGIMEKIMERYRR